MLLLVIYRSVLIVSGSFILGGHVAAAVPLVGAFYNLHLVLVHGLLLRSLQFLVRQLPHISILYELRKQTSLANLRLYSEISGGDARRTPSPRSMRGRRRYSRTRAFRFVFSQQLVRLAGRARFLRGTTPPARTRSRTR